MATHTHTRTGAETEFWHLHAEANDGGKNDNPVSYCYLPVAVGEPDVQPWF